MIHIPKDSAGLTREKNRRSKFRSSCESNAGAAAARHRGVVNTLDDRGPRFLLAVYTQSNLRFAHPSDETIEVKDTSVTRTPREGAGKKTHRKCDPHHTCVVLICKHRKPSAHATLSSSPRMLTGFLLSVTTTTDELGKLGSQSPGK